MFNNLLTKFKDTRDIRLSTLKQRFSSANAILISSAKQFKMPTYELPKFINKFPAYQPIKPILKKSLLTTALRVSSSKFVSLLSRRNAALSVLASVAGYYAYQYNPTVTKIRISYDTNEFNQKLVSELSHLNDKHFYPNFIATTAIMQCVMHNTIKLSVRYVRDVVPLKDGGQVVLDWALPTKKVELADTKFNGRDYAYQPADDNKIMFIIHGLTGGSETNYIQTLVDSARKSGYRVVVMNQRGVNQPLASPTPFHGGPCDDVAEAVNAVKAKYPNAPLVAVGTSFGGNQLLRYLGETGEKTPFDAAVLLAAPFDLTHCVDDVEGTVYEKFFVRSYLEKNFLPNLDMFKKLENSHGIDVEEILKVKKLRDYHTQFTAKVFNHKDADDYFEGSKIHDHHIKNVTIPTMVMHARDDPIAVHRSIPVHTLKTNPNIIYAETKHGGHLGWFSGLYPKRWYSEPTVQFLDKAMELKEQEKN